MARSFSLTLVVDFVALGPVDAREAFAMLITSPGVDGVCAAVAGLVAEQPADRPDVVAMGNVERLLTVCSQLHAQLARELAVIDAHAATVQDCGRHTRAWLVEEQSLDPGAAARKMRIARHLGRWPATEAAWLAGDISEDHVAVIFKALATVPPEVADVVEKALLEIAHLSPPRDVAAAVDQILIACGIDDADAAAARRYASRGVTVAKTFGGTGSLSGTLSATLADKLTRALEHAGAPTDADDDRSQAQRFHDALETMTDHYLDTAELPTEQRGERPARVIVTIALETLERRLEGGWGLLPAGAYVSPETARRIACDAEVIPVVLNGRNVIDIGIANRTFSEHVRRAAVIRDGDRCVYPQCRSPRKQAHHWRVHWADGGTSDLDNCAWLCTFHHWLVHESNWSMRREADGGYTFTSPNGKQRTSSKAPIRGPSDPDPPDE